MVSAGLDTPAEREADGSDDTSRANAPGTARGQMSHDLPATDSSAPPVPDPSCSIVAVEKKSVQRSKQAQFRPFDEEKQEEIRIRAGRLSGSFNLTFRCTGPHDVQVSPTRLSSASSSQSRSSLHPPEPPQYLIDVPADGRCLFHALAAHVTGTSDRERPLST